MACCYDFHYLEFGNRSQPPVLFLHGFLGSAEEWRDVATLCSSDHWCLAVDLPGHGQTVVRGRDDWYRFENCAAEIIRYLGSRNVGACDVVGYSMGGRLALYMAVKHPDRFGKIVLESASPGLETDRERRPRRARDNRLAEQLEHGTLQEFLHQWYRQPLFATLRSDVTAYDRLMELRQRGDRQGLAVALRMMGVGVQPSLWDDLEKIPADLLLIVGEKDHKFKAIADNMATRCSSASVSIVKGAGHNVHWERPDRFARLVRDFLSAKKRG